MTPKRAAVFLDRDGVLNEPVVRNGKPFPPTSVDTVEIVAGAPLDVTRLHAAGFAVYCVTNQPDVARGTLAGTTARAIMQHIADAVGIDDSLVCYHDDADACACRKPLPGLLVQGAKRHDVDLATSYMVGDRWKDIDAGAAAGCKTIFIDRRWAERAPAAEPNAIVTTLSAAVDWIVKDSQA